MASCGRPSMRWRSTSPPHVRAEKGWQAIDLMVSGLTCGACVWLVEQALAAEPGRDPRPRRAVHAPADAGLARRGGAGQRLRRPAGAARLPRRALVAGLPAGDRGCRGARADPCLGIAAFGAMNVMLVSVAVWVGWDMGEATRAAMHWLAALIGLPVVLVAGMPLYRNALAGLRSGRLNMDMAVSLGVLATRGDVAERGAAQRPLHLLRRRDDADRAAAGRPRAGPRGAPEGPPGGGRTAGLAGRHGDAAGRGRHGAEAAPAANLRAGDRILVAAGERLRLDATLEAGEALLDTSATTGESLPRSFAAHEALPAGAVNMGAPFVARVTAAAADGSLAAMARLLEQAEQAQGPLSSTWPTGWCGISCRWCMRWRRSTFLGWWLLRRRGLAAGAGRRRRRADRHLPLRLRHRPAGGAGGGRRRAVPPRRAGRQRHRAGTAGLRRPRRAGQDRDADRGPPDPAARRLDRGRVARGRRPGPRQPPPAGPRPGQCLPRGAAACRACRRCRAVAWSPASAGWAAPPSSAWAGRMPG